MRHRGVFAFWPRVWELWHYREYGYRFDYEGFFRSMFSDATELEVNEYCARRR